jgi:mono/diheme cytochrome c family protein
MSAMDRVLRIMHGITAVVTAAFIILLFTNEPQQPQIVPAASASVGEQIYKTRCASCHSADGSGGFGPALTGIVDRFPNAGDQEVVIANGRGSMPSFATSLTPEQIAAVVEYTRTELR